MIPTPQSIRRLQRRLDRKRIGICSVLSVLKSGGTLHLQYGRAGRKMWILLEPHGGGSRFIDDELARIVVAHPEVVGVGDALFANVPSQTYRHI